jgi:Fis family transcriptional regulator
MHSLEVNVKDPGLNPLDLLSRVGELIHSVPTSRERFLEIMKLLDEAFGTGYGTLTLFSPSRNRTILEVVFGEPSQEQGFSQGLKPATIREVLERSQPVAFSRMSQQPLSIPVQSLQEKRLSLICVPVMNTAGAVGVMGTGPLYRDSLSVDDDIRFLKLIACMAFRDAPLPSDDHDPRRDPTDDPPLNEILETKLRQMIEKVDPGTESRCALLPDIISLVEKIVIKWSLRRHQNVKTATAHFLGINRNTLRKKMEEFNIHVRDL